MKQEYKFNYVNSVIEDFLEWADYDGEIAEYEIIDDLYILAWCHGDYDDKHIDINTFKTKLELAQWCFNQLDKYCYYDESAESDPEGIENRIRDEYYEAIFGNKNNM